MKVPHDVVRANVATALREDLGSGDVHASLVASESLRRGIIISRSKGVLCGRQWVEETYRQVCESTSVEWECDEGGTIVSDQRLATITGPSSALLTAERTALNFLQLLSATATRTRHFTKLIEHTSARILDTRKTLPGLRVAQKHAVHVGRGVNHRMGLFECHSHQGKSHRRMRWAGTGHHSSSRATSNHVSRSRSGFAGTLRSSHEV